MLADYYTIQNIYYAIAVGILPDPTGGAGFREVLGNQGQIQDIYRAVHVDIRCRINGRYGYGYVF
jgi:hypothetical protein